MKPYTLTCPHCNIVYQISPRVPVTDSGQIKLMQCKKCQKQIFYFPKIEVTFAAFTDEKKAEKQWTDYIQKTYKEK